MTELVDMLAIQMEEYYRLTHILNNSERFLACYEKVQALQDEIDDRKRKEHNL